jgi:flagellar biosynthesis protein FlhA
VIEGLALSFTLVLTRMGGFVSFVPVLGGRDVPRTVKIGLALALSILCFGAEGTLPPDDLLPTADKGPWLAYGLALGREALIGAVVGAARFTLDAMPGRQMAIDAELNAGAIDESVVDAKGGSGLLDRIGGLRRDLARKNGLWVPLVRLRDSIQLEADSYRILIGGREVARGQLRPGRWLAIDPGTTRLAIDGEATKDPAFGLPAKWISENDRQRAELGGFTVVDAPRVLITHLGEILRRHAHELLGREDLKLLVDKVRETNAAVVDELIPNVITMGVLHRVLSLLLEERVPISNLTRILESLAHHAPATKDPAELAERVRGDMGRAVCDRFRDEQGRIHAIVFDPRLEVELRRGLHDKQLVLDPARLEKLIVRLATEWRRVSARGQDVALLTDISLRRAVRYALTRTLPDLAVIAYQEVPGDLLLEAAAMLKPDDLGAPKHEEAQAAQPAARR